MYHSLCGATHLSGNQSKVTAKLCRLLLTRHMSSTMIARRDVEITNYLSNARDSADEIVELLAKIHEDA
jgi:hypothetical protein